MNECQIVDCQEPACEKSLDYAMMCEEHYIGWLEDRVMLEDHPDDCPCSYHS